MEYLKRHKGFGGDQSISDSSQSLDRFVRAANMLNNYNPNIQASSVDYAFNILDNVAQNLWAFRTQWSIVYDIQKLRIYFQTFSNKQIRYMDLHSFDFSCQSPVKVLDMNIDGSGDMKANFQDCTRNMNLDLIRHSWKESNMPDSFLERLSTYPERTRCDE
jgi:penicillin V acylase-like amidase (Ntn superfamily)